MSDDRSPQRRPARIRPLETGDLDAAARLLAERHRRHRIGEPLLDASFEDPAVTRPAIEAALAADRGSGWVAVSDGDVVGYLVGSQKSVDTWGENVWIEGAGHAAVDPSIVRELYAVAAAAWVDEGRKNHHVLVPGTDAGLVDAWFTLDFGQQHVHAIREVPPASFGVVPRSELIVRRGTRDDLDTLVVLDAVLPAHLTLSPVFSTLKPFPIEEARAELEEDLAGETFTYWVAEHEGRVVGSAIGCALDVSPGHIAPNRTPNSAFLGFVAVLPDARGLGAGRALGDTVLAWSRDAGFTSISTDWRSANLEADRTWRSMGFRPTFRRLHRLIG